MTLPYRDNVGALLFNTAGRVLIARRADLPNAEGAAGGWQLPQGGMDADEDPAIAIFRELQEESAPTRPRFWPNTQAGCFMTCRQN